MKYLKLFEDFEEFDWEEEEEEKKPIRIKKGLVVKIKPESEIRKYNFHPQYMKYNLQISDEIVEIKRAFRDPISRYGPLSKFEVDGYDLYSPYREVSGSSGFDDVIIDKVIE